MTSSLCPRDLTGYRFASHAARIRQLRSGIADHLAASRRHPERARRHQRAAARLLLEMRRIEAEQLHAEIRVLADGARRMRDVSTV